MTLINYIKVIRPHSKRAVIFFFDLEALLLMTCGSSSSFHYAPLSNLGQLLPDFTGCRGAATSRYTRTRLISDLWEREEPRRLIVITTSLPETLPTFGLRVQI